MFFVFTWNAKDALYSEVPMSLMARTRTLCAVKDGSSEKEV